jgi:hypothetical protein
MNKQHVWAIRKLRLMGQRCLSLAVMLNDHYRLCRHVDDLATEQAPGG